MNFNITFQGFNAGSVDQSCFPLNVEAKVYSSTDTGGTCTPCGVSGECTPCNPTSGTNYDVILVTASPGTPIVNSIPYVEWTAIQSGTIQFMISNFELAEGDCLYVRINSVLCGCESCFVFQNGQLPISCDTNLTVITIS